MASTPSGAGSPVLTSSGCTVAIRARSGSGSGVCFGRRLMFWPAWDRDPPSLGLVGRREDVHVVE